eukprot:COSAG01_NODE_8742_length_2675_cov_8.725543_1_plen_91_part_00
MHTPQRSILACCINVNAGSILGSFHKKNGRAPVLFGHAKSANLTRKSHSEGPQNQKFLHLSDKMLYQPDRKFRESGIRTGLLDWTAGLTD